MKILFTINLMLISLVMVAQPGSQHDLYFDSIPTRWDEAMPLGNGWLGTLVYRKADHIRMSLDRVDLWDDRPMPMIDKLTFKWVEDQVRKRKYDTVQKIGDAPYEENAAPTKIPGAAIEFDISKFGKVNANRLDISKAVNVITFQNGVQFSNYVHASKQYGLFYFENVQEAIVPELKIPAYHTGLAGRKGNSVEGQGLERLGYDGGTITKGKHFIRYHQPGWNGNFYEVLVQWQFDGHKMTGQWTISKNVKASLPVLTTKGSDPVDWNAHISWWKNYWERSSVHIPDTVLEKQYYLELYKMGCVAREHTPPISLQAIWTADDGNLPPWKGDLHHDLNTQLSYWPFYTSNHLKEAASYTNWIWNVREANRKWTKSYFGTDGLNMPGVTTISGKPMGGWIQYSMSPTTAAWLSQHFFWQWKFSGDKKFMKERCLPWFDEAETFIMKLRVWDSVKHQYRLPLSSSPEYHDNSINAWFTQNTNYDLALIQGLYKNYVELLNADPPRSVKEIWLDSRLYPGQDMDSTGLTIAPGQPLDESHRHHAHLMAIYPIGLLSPDDENERQVISRSLRHLEHTGTRQWCGYSFSWAACLYARAREGEQAANMLKIFATAFVSPNSFHLNGDQQGGRYSSFRYRPFTLEGNFAFAQGVNEMLVQGYNGYIEIFPAVPVSWKDISFKTLRTEGAFLVSAKKENGIVTECTILSEQGGTLRIRKPFKTLLLGGVQKRFTQEGDIMIFDMKKGETIKLINGYE